MVSDLPIRFAPVEKKKAGIEFEGNLRFLIEKYEDVEEVFKRMTLGQLNKYSVIEKKIWNLKTNKIAYDIETKEIFE